MMKTIMKIGCSWCGMDMGEKDGGGVTGTTSGICSECNHIERLKLAQHLVKAKKATWEEAKRKAGVK